jgi:hypothetical protein
MPVISYIGPCRPPAPAETAFLHAIDSGYRMWHPWQLATSATCWPSGDVAGARTAFQRRRGRHTDTASRAADNFGRLLNKEGDTKGVKAAY